MPLYSMLSGFAQRRARFASGPVEYGCSGECQRWRSVSTDSCCAAASVSHGGTGRFGLLQGVNKQIQLEFSVPDSQQKHGSRNRRDEGRRGLPTESPVASAPNGRAEVAQPFPAAGRSAESRRSGRECWTNGPRRVLTALLTCRAADPASMRRGRGLKSMGGKTWIDTDPGSR